MASQVPVSAFAEYNQFGYTVYVTDKDGGLIHDLIVACGNCAYESTTIVALTSSHCLSLDRIREMALAVAQACATTLNI